MPPNRRRAQPLLLILQLLCRAAADQFPLSHKVIVHQQQAVPPAPHALAQAIRDLLSQVREPILNKRTVKLPEAASRWNMAGAKTARQQASLLLLLFEAAAVQQPETPVSTVGLKPNWQSRMPTPP